MLMSALKHGAHNLAFELKYRHRLALELKCEAHKLAFELKRDPRAWEMRFVLVRLAFEDLSSIIFR